MCISKRTGTLWHGWKNLKGRGESNVYAFCGPPRPQWVSTPSPTRYDRTPFNCEPVNPLLSLGFVNILPVRWTREKGAPCREELGELGLCLEAWTPWLLTSAQQFRGLAVAPIFPFIA